MPQHILEGRCYRPILVAESTYIGPLDDQYRFILPPSIWGVRVGRCSRRGASCALLRICNYVLLELLGVTGMLSVGIG